MEYNRTKFEKLWQEYEDEFWKETNKNLNNFLNHITNVKKDKNCNPNNNAPKSIKGDYDLSIHGNKIVLVDNVDGTTVEAKCHPDDDFDVGVGIKEAFKKLNDKREKIRKQKDEEEKKIKVGDWVEVVDWTYGYSKYASWLYDKVGFNYVRMLDYENPSCNGLRGQVIAIGTHENNGRNLVGFCTADNKVYIVEDIGLKKVVKPNV